MIYILLAFIDILSWFYFYILFLIFNFFILCVPILVVLVNLFVLVYFTFNSITDFFNSFSYNNFTFQSIHFLYLNIFKILKHCFFSGLNLDPTVSRK